MPGHCSVPTPVPLPHLPPNATMQLLSSVVQVHPETTGLHCIHLSTPFPAKGIFLKIHFSLDTTTMLQREMVDHQLSVSSRGAGAGERGAKKKSKKQTKNTFCYQTWHLRPHEHQATCNSTKSLK